MPDSNTNTNTYSFFDEFSCIDKAVYVACFYTYLGAMILFGGCYGIYCGCCQVGSFLSSAFCGTC
jgi:hypothetical protein